MHGRKGRDVRHPVLFIVAAPEENERIIGSSVVRVGRVDGYTCDHVTRKTHCEHRKIPYPRGLFRIRVSHYIRHLFGRRDKGVLHWKVCCHNMGLKCGYSLVYVVLSIAFAARLLVNHGVIHPDYQTYLPSFGNHTQHVLFREDASALSLVGSLIYAALECNARIMYAVHISVDSVLVSMLLCIMLGVGDVFHLATLVTIYLAFHLLMIDGRGAFVPGLLIVVFWSQAFAFLLFGGTTLSKLGAASAVFLDVWTLTPKDRVKAVGREILARHVVRVVLLVSVFFN